MKKIFIITLFLVMLVFSGCNEPRACTLEYAPVCGVDGVTYGNACAAGTVKIDYTGECKVDVHVCTEDEKNVQVCTMEYVGVCGSDGKTYATGCTACAAKIDSYTMGECPTDNPQTEQLSPTDGNSVQGSPGAATITLAELNLHNSINDCWVAYEGKVYDITEFIKTHPPGMLSQLCGQAQGFEEKFVSQHGSSKLDKLGTNPYMGELV